MGLNIARLLTKGVGTAAKLLASALVEVQHEPFVQRDKAGKPEYGIVARRKAVVEQRTRTLRATTTGMEIVVTGPITFLGSVPVNNEDRITLPSGEVAVVAFVNRVLSPLAIAGQGYVTEVWLGEFGR